MNERFESNKLWLGALVVLALTAAAHLRGLRGQFVEWDDPGHVTRNAVIRALTFEKVRVMFTMPIAKLYCPLTTLSYAIDYQLWGQGPLGYHVVNLLLHLANTLLVLVLVRKILCDRHEHATMTAILTAAIFGVHPLRVESVAWVTERKDVLSGFFGLLALLAYALYARGQMQNAECRMKKPALPNAQPLHVSRFTFHASAFTLIELLVVIAIMATLAALLLPVVGAVKKHQYIYNAQAEMAKLETAIDNYKAVYGFYPPSPPLPPTAGNPASLVNQLYYELLGTTNNTANGNVYQTLDGSAQINVSDVPTAFPGVGGFMNCSKPNGGEDASTARNFLSDLKPNQIGIATVGGVPVTVLITADNGPDALYRPLGALGQPGENPWRYNSSHPVSNPGSYDLYIQLSISGKTNLICNWSKEVRTDSSLP